jgi:hypothetical protein
MAKAYKKGDKYVLELNEGEAEIVAILLNEADHVLADDGPEIAFRIMDKMERGWPDND